MELNKLKLLQQHKYQIINTINNIKLLRRLNTHNIHRSEEHRIKKTLFVVASLFSAI
jgi:hypothetical protein